MATFVNQCKVNGCNTAIKQYELNNNILHYYCQRLWPLWFYCWQLLLCFSIAGGSCLHFLTQACVLFTVEWSGFHVVTLVASDLIDFMVEGSGLHFFMAASGLHFLTVEATGIHFFTVGASSVFCLALGLAALAEGHWISTCGRYARKPVWAY